MNIQVKYTDVFAYVKNTCQNGLVGEQPMPVGPSVGLATACGLLAAEGHGRACGSTERSGGDGFHPGESVLM